MHVNQQRAAGDDLGDPANLLGAPAGAGNPSSRSSGCQRRAAGLPTMHQDEDGRTRDETAGCHRRRLHDYWGASWHDLAR
jgi:hypothetical protein